MLPHKVNDLFPAPPSVRCAKRFGRHVLGTNPLGDFYSLSDELFHSGMYFGDHRPFDMRHGRVSIPADGGDMRGIGVDVLNRVT